MTDPIPPTPTPRGGRILRNLGALGVGRVVGDVFAILLFMVMTRRIGEVGVGVYAFGMAFTGFFALFADFGLANFSIKGISRRTDGVAEFLGEVFAARLFTTAVTSALLALSLWVFPFGRETHEVVLVLGLYHILYSHLDGVAAVFVGREEMHIAGLLELAMRVVSAVGAGVVVWQGGSLGAAVLFFPLAVALLLIVAHALLQTRLRGWQRHVPAGRANIPENLRRTAPFGQIELLRHMATRIDVVLLQFIAGAAATGIYSAAYRVVFSIQFLPHLAQLSLFPVASKLFTESREELTRLYTTAMRVAVLLTVPAVAGVWLIATPLVRVAFGDDFGEAVPVLRVLAPFLIVISFKHLAGMFLMACDLEGKNTKGQWLGSILNVIGNVSLIPVLGPVGAALATIVSESVGVVYFFLHLRPVLGWPQLTSRVALALVGSAAFLLPGVFIPGLSLWIIVPAAALVYAGVLLSFRSVREEEIKMLGESIRTFRQR